MATIGKPDNLTSRQRKAIAALLTSGDIKSAAVTAGIGARTLYRWMTLPEFRAALLEAEGDAIDAATRRLLTLQTPAIDVLETTMSDRESPPAVRLRAAQSVLDYLLRLRELRNVEDRLAALEARINVNKHR